MQSNRPENSNDPLTPVELFRRGIEITREIRGRIIETRAYYLGRSSREPEEPLSEVFNPETGPIIPYFVKVIRMLTHPQAYLTLRQSAALKEFERESARTLDALRRLAIDLAPVLNAKDGQPAIGRSLKLSIYFFRAANRRFFRYLVRRRSILHRLLGNQINEGFVLYVADRLLNDIAKAFEARERQLRGESAAPAHEFFTKQFERIERKIESEHERTRRQIIKSINTRNIDGLDITGPRTPECRDQVMSVVVWLANPKHPQSIYHACERTFHFVENGYVDEERLYLWCHRNESRIWAWVETYRLDHSIS